MFCVKDRGKDGPVLAAKYMKDKTVDGNTEVEILRSLQGSEHVVKIVESLHQSYQTILITEYLAGQSVSHSSLKEGSQYICLLGGNLFERLSDSEYQLTENKCRVFVKQIMSGVSFIHDKNILHLNITPTNIIFHNKVTLNLVA